MEKMEFSANWNNKLDCKCFTTIRVYNPTKHFRGNQFAISLRKKHKSKAVVLGITKALIHELNDYVCYLDTGYNRAETIELLKKMYPKFDFKNQYLCILLLKKIEPPKSVQGTLF